MSGTPILEIEFVNVESALFLCVQIRTKRVAGHLVFRFIAHYQGIGLRVHRNEWDEAKLQPGLRSQTSQTTLQLKQALVIGHLQQQ
jgi:hypothetical protein